MTDTRSLMHRRTGGTAFWQLMRAAFLKDGMHQLASAEPSPAQMALARVTCSLARLATPALGRRKAVALGMEVGLAN